MIKETKLPVPTPPVKTAGLSGEQTTLMDIYKFKIIGGPCDGQTHVSETPDPPTKIMATPRMTFPRPIGSLIEIQAPEFTRHLYRRVEIRSSAETFFFYAPNALDNSQAIALLVRP